MENFFLYYSCTKKIAYNPADLVPYLDEFHVMSNDFLDGSWGESIASHHTNLYPANHTKYSTKAAVDAFISKGVPRDKILIGAAYYSRGFSNTDGLGKPASGGSADKSWEDGVVDYKKLPITGATEYYDSEACAAYFYDPVRRIFNRYDNVELDAKLLDATPSLQSAPTVPNAQLPSIAQPPRPATKIKDEDEELEALKASMAL